MREDNTYMKKEEVVHLTVVPADNLIVLNNEGLQLENVPFHILEQHNLMHALQYHNGKGHIEWTEERNEVNRILTEDDFETDVQPYVEMFIAEKKIKEQKEEEERIEQERLYNSEEQRFIRLRSARDGKLAASDFRMTADVFNSMSPEEQQAWIDYREALRVLPEQDGAPWDGGEELTPFPPEPNFPKK